MHRAFTYLVDYERMENASRRPYTKRLRSASTNPSADVHAMSGIVGKVDPLKLLFEATRRILPHCFMADNVVRAFARCVESVATAEIQVSDRKSGVCVTSQVGALSVGAAVCFYASTFLTDFINSSVSVVRVERAYLVELLVAAVRLAAKYVEDDEVIVFEVVKRVAFFLILFDEDDANPRMRWQAIDLWRHETVLLLASFRPKSRGIVWVVDFK